MEDDYTLDTDVFGDQEQDEEEPEYPGTDPDGRERLPLFAGRFAAASTAMEGVERPPAEPRSTAPGEVAASPFV